MAETLFEVAEMIFVAIFMAVGWSSQLSFLEVGSFNYWFVCGLTTAYLFFLLFKIIWKHARKPIK